ncbi:MAG: AAA family ATPase [Lentisphaerae bacterium]|nr:AAA family ATPase [Lentisphaerota bacterium]
MTTYKQREITGVLAKALAIMPVVVLSGMRQTGKSTLLREDPVLRGRRYLSLDDFAVLEAARNRPEELLGEGDVTVDECQKCPELLTAIKRLVDQSRRPGRFLLSGTSGA